MLRNPATAEERALRAYLDGRNLDLMVLLSGPGENANAFLRRIAGRGLADGLIIADGRSQEIGRFTAIAASLIVIGSAGTLLLGSLERFFR